MKYMILAAGQGTRLKPITDTIPKPAVPLLGVPMIFYPVQYFGPGPIVINAFHLEDVLRKTLSEYPDFKAEIISDGPTLLGSGGGVKNAEKLLKGNGHFCLVNGDSVFLADDKTFLEKAEKLHLKNKALATIVVIEDERIQTQGWGAIWADNTGRVTDMGKKQLSGNFIGYHFIGFMILSDKVFDYLPNGESHIFENALKPPIAKGDLVQVYKTSGRWFETGNLADFKATEKVLLKDLQEGSEYLMSLQKNFA